MRAHMDAESSGREDPDQEVCAQGMESQSEEKMFFF